MSRRGRAPKYNKKGKARCFTNPEEMQRQFQKARDEESSESEKDENITNNKLEEKSEHSSGSEEEENDAHLKSKGIQGLIEIENPNRVPIKASKKAETLDFSGSGKVQLSRREKEVIEKQKAAERYEQLHKEGKTEEAIKDMERLALIRKQREEQAAIRLAGKEKDISSKSTAANAFKKKQPAAQ